MESANPLNWGFVVFYSKKRRIAIISYIFMIKSARKPSSDPVQEKLRQSKAVWNKEVSIFVNDLIHCKKLMNGWPSKFHMEKSFIKEPIPADPSTIIGSLLSDFNDIAQKGNNVIKQQLEYAKTRRKRQPKQLNLPLGTSPTAPATQTAPAPTNQLSLPLAASFEEKYELVAEGSSAFTRFFARLLNPAFGIGEAARIRKYRRSLLDSCVKTYKDLGKLQVEIVSSSKNSLPNSNKLLHKAWADWMVIYRGYSLYKSNMPKEVKDAGGELSTTNKKDNGEKPTSDTVGTLPAANTSKVAVESIIDDYKKSLNEFAGEAEVFKDLNNAFTAFKMSQTADKKAAAAKDIITAYSNVLNTLNSKYETVGSTLEQIAEAKSSSVVTASLEKVAQDFLRKWLGKTRHELSFFDDKNKSNYRLDIYKKAGEIRKIIDQIMNCLEKDMKIDELDPLIIEVNKEITAMRGVMLALNRVEPVTPKSSKMPNPENMGMMDRMNMLEKYM